VVDTPDTQEGWHTPSVKHMNFIAWIIMGLIAGAIAKSIMKEKGGWVSSLVIGLIGGVTGFFSIWSWLLAIGGSVLVLWIYNLIQRKR